MEYINEQVIGTFKNISSAQKCREVLLEIYGSDRPWFYVYNTGDVTVTNEFGGPLKDALFSSMKQFAVEWEKDDGPKNEKEDIFVGIDVNVLSSFDDPNNVLS